MSKYKYDNKYDNEYEFRIFGLKRSGNHTILAGIMSTFNENEVYLHNNVQIIKNLFIGDLNRKNGRRPFDNKDIDFFDRLTNRLTDQDNYSKKGRLNKKKCIIHTYEDKSLSIISEIKTVNIGKSKNIFNVIILRDPYNMLASRIAFVNKNKDLQKKHFTKFITPEDIMILWKEYAREFLNITNNVPNKICINYNKLVTDQQYKREIYHKLMLDPEKVDDNIILGFGRGSSFIGQNLEINKNEYNERWKKVDIKQYIDTESETLSELIFGIIIDS